MNNAFFGGKLERCNRGIYTSKHCYAVLKPEQHTQGEAIVIMNKHREGITDTISEDELSDFMVAINKVASMIKKVAINENLLHPERIYVGILCDGKNSEHLHAHLIPRYPFGQYDKDKYKNFFEIRDSRSEILRKQKEDDLGGYWYVFDKEQNVDNTTYAQWTKGKKIIYLEKLAKDLRSMSLL